MTTAVAELLEQPGVLISCFLFFRVFVIEFGKTESRKHEKTKARKKGKPAGSWNEVEPGRQE
jgi:hypothetical protein